MFQPIKSPVSILMLTVYHYSINQFMRLHQVWPESPWKTALGLRFGRFIGPLGHSTGGRAS